MRDLVRRGKESQKHLSMKKYVMTKAIAEGFYTHVEWRWCDVALIESETLLSVAVEIELSTANIFKNVHRNVKLSFDKLLIVSDDSIILDWVTVNCSSPEIVTCLFSDLKMTNIRQILSI